MSSFAPWSGWSRLLDSQSDCTNTAPLQGNARHAGRVSRVSALNKDTESDGIESDGIEKRTTESYCCSPVSGQLRRVTVPNSSTTSTVTVTPCGIWPGAISAVALAVQIHDPSGR